MQSAPLISALGVYSPTSWDELSHELRHTIEVLSDPMVTNRHTMSNFYQLQGSKAAEGRFETQAAIEAGLAVSAEVRKYCASVRAD